MASKSVPRKTATRVGSPKSQINTVQPTDMHQCSCCGRQWKLQASKFYTSKSPLFINNNGYINICIDCIDELFLKIDRILNNPTETVKQLCQMFDWYFDYDAVEAAKALTDKQTLISAYMKSRKNLHGKIEDLTYLDFLQEDLLNQTQKKVSNDFDDMIAKAKPTNYITTEVIERFGIADFSPDDYMVMEQHYQMLKKANPNIDSNTEIFILDLCRIKLFQMNALKTGNADLFDKMSKSYRETFKQANLNTLNESDSSADETLGVTLQTISQYTPEEYYKDKKLYEDFDGVKDYFKRFVLRPLKNLQFGTKERDHEFFVPDDGDEDV